MNAKTKTAALANPKPFKGKTVLTPKPVNADILNMPTSARKRYLSDVAAEFKKYGFTVTCSFYEHAVRCSKAEATFQVFDSKGGDTGLRIATVALAQLLRDGVLVKTEKTVGHAVFMHKTLVPKKAKKASTVIDLSPKPGVAYPRIAYDSSQLARMPVPTFAYQRVTFKGQGKTSIRCSEREWAQLTAHRKNRRVIGNAVQVCAPRTVSVQDLLKAAGFKAAGTAGLTKRIPVANPSARWATAEETEEWLNGELELRRTMALRLLDHAASRVEEEEEDLADALKSIELQKETIVEVKAKKAQLDKELGYLRLI